MRGRCRFGLSCRDLHVREPKGWAAGSTTGKSTGKGAGKGAGKKTPVAKTDENTRPSPEKNSDIVSSAIASSSPVHTAGDHKNVVDVVAYEKELRKRAEKVESLQSEKLRLQQERTAALRAVLTKTDK